MAPEALIGGEYPQRGLWGQHVSTLVGLLEDAANSSSSNGGAANRGTALTTRRRKSMLFFDELELDAHVTKPRLKKTSMKSFVQ